MVSFVICVAGRVNIFDPLRGDWVLLHMDKSMNVVVENKQI